MYVWRSTQRDSFPSNFIVVAGMLSLFFILLMVVLISIGQVSLPGTKVSLPRLEHVRTDTVDKLFVTVTRDSELFFDGSLLGWDELARQLSERVTRSRLDGDDLKDNKDKPMIVVCADREVNLQTWFRLVDIARGLGLDIYLASEHPDAGSDNNGGKAKLDEQL